MKRRKQTLQPFHDNKIPPHFAFMTDDGEARGRVEHEVMTYLRHSVNEFLESYRIDDGCTVAKDNLLGSGYRFRFIDRYKREHTFGITYDEMIAAGEISAVGMVDRIRDTVLSRAKKSLEESHGREEAPTG